MNRINLQVVDYTTLEFNRGATMSYGKRLGLVDPAHKGLIPTNPTGEFGELGIRYHNLFERLFYSTLAVQAVEAESAVEKTFYLNKRNTVRWLNCQLADEEKVTEKTADADMVQRINNLSAVLRARKEKAVEGVEKTYKASVSSQHLRKGLLDDLKVIFWRLFFRITNSSWSLLRLRFSLQLREKTIDTASKILGAATFRDAVEAVPAYLNFMRSKDVRLVRFSDVPVTSKDNYIKPALKHEEEVSLYVGGKVPLKAKRDTSTGTSGPSTPWYRGLKEQQHVEKMTTYAAKAILGDRPYSFINGFAMGPWATGVTATLAMQNNAQAGVAVIGPNIDEIYACLKEQARIYGKEHPIVVSGYPPHLRAVVDKAQAEGFPIHDYTVLGVVGGEAMSEDLRDLLVAQKKGDGTIVRTGFKQCYSSYGASDLDINIGYESDFEIELRKVLHRPEHAALAEELFGKNEFKPMIFHYDPLNYLIESDEQRKLALTCVRGDRISPRVRYELGDIGKTMPVSELLATLKKHGVRLHNLPNTSLPLLFIWGRVGSHISFRGCKVAPENLGETIRRLDSSEVPGLNGQIAHYGFYQYEQEGKTVTEILLEFNDDAAFEAADKELLTQLIQKLAQVNTDFVAQISACPEAEKPVLRVFKKGESPMDVQQKRYPMRKKQYIFKAGDEFIKDHKADMAPKGKLVSV